MMKLMQQEARTLLNSAVDSFPHDACLMCECFLGYVTQLYLDSDPNERELLVEYQVDRNSMHSCLGCDPCPPGDLYALYIRNKKGPQIITLD